jgi:hypothetical protein
VSHFGLSSIPSSTKNLQGICSTVAYFMALSFHSFIQFLVQWYKVAPIENVGLAYVNRVQIVIECFLYIFNFWSSVIEFRDFFSRLIVLLSSI